MSPPASGRQTRGESWLSDNEMPVDVGTRPSQPSPEWKRLDGEVRRNPSSRLPLRDFTRLGGVSPAWAQPTARI